MISPSLPEEKKSFWSEAESIGGPAGLRCFVHRRYQINMHRHDFYELNLVLKGKGVHYFEGNHFQIERGDLFVIPPGFRHGYVMTEELDVYHMLIGRRFLLRHAAELEALPGFRMLLTVEPVFRREMNFRYFLRLDDEKLGRLMPELERLCDPYYADCPEAPAIVGGLALFCIAEICRLYREQYTLDPALLSGGAFASVTRCIELVEERYAEKLTIDDFTRAASVSKSTLFRIFSRVTGSTPAGYLNGYRIGKARELLAVTDTDISEIVALTGFYDSAHFDHVFRRHVGMTPFAYRKLIRGEGRNGRFNVS